MNTIKVTHNGNGLGSIYLADIGKRFGLGGGYQVPGKLGQDQYLNVGETVELEASDEVLMSAVKGIIAKHVATGAFTVEYLENGVLMASLPKVEVENIGSSNIYLADIGLRYGLGGSLYVNQAAQILEHGQDMYIAPGSTITLVPTELVLESMNSGALSKQQAKGNLEVTLIPAATGTTTVIDGFTVM